MVKHVRDDKGQMNIRESHQERLWLELVPVAEKMKATKDSIKYMDEQKWSGQGKLYHNCCLLNSSSTSNARGHRLRKLKMANSTSAAMQTHIHSDTHTRWDNRRQTRSITCSLSTWYILIAGLFLLVGSFPPSEPCSSLALINFSLIDSRNSTQVYTRFN
jgi:hypothetical protein